MTREQALARIPELLEEDALAEAMRLISLFNIQAEELTEEGLSFETVSALEKRCCLF